MKISVIIPVYGVEKYIEHCARSLFRQDTTDLEYIFVNDATKDHSIDILKELISNNFPHLKERITIIEKTTNEGLPQARKTGISHATGDYIMHCDSDDWVADDAIRNIVKTIDETSADIIYFNYYQSSEVSDTCSNEDIFSDSIEYAKAMMSFSPRSGAYCWNKVIKRSLYQKVTEWPVCNMHEDVALMPQIIIQSQSLAFINTPLYHYRLSSSSSMSTDFGKNREKKIQSQSNQFILVHFLEKQHIVPEFRRQYQQMISRCAYIAVFFYPSSIERYPQFRSIWSIPLFFHFDVSIRKQIQSRIVISFHLLRSLLK